MMTREYWVLRDKRAVPVATIEEWAREYDENTRRVAETTIGKSWISTVFLGIDHSFGGPRPLLFESMVFGGPLADEQIRYSTWDEAERGHADLVARVTSATESDAPVSQPGASAEPSQP